MRFRAVQYGPEDRLKGLFDLLFQITEAQRNVSTLRNEYDNTRTEPGGIGYAVPSWHWYVHTAFFEPSTTRDQPDPERIRCDNAFATDGNDLGDPESFSTTGVFGNGCVVPSYVPTWVVLKNGLYPTVAYHVEAAQNSGLPGAYPGSPGGQLQLLGEDTVPPSRLPLGEPEAGLPAGRYRLLVAGRNRDDGEARSATMPVEEYLIRIWPASHTDRTAETVLKETSTTGAIWRGESG